MQTTIFSWAHHSYLATVDETDIFFAEVSVLYTEDAFEVVPCCCRSNTAYNNAAGCNRVASITVTGGAFIGSSHNAENTPHIMLSEPELMQ